MYFAEIVPDKMTKPSMQMFIVNCIVHEQNFALIVASKCWSLFFIIIYVIMKGPNKNNQTLKKLSLYSKVSSEKKKPVVKHCSKAIRIS